MKLIVLGSSSKGNGYVLTNGKESLVLEAGVPFAKVREALCYNVSSIKACLTTHIHGDHAKYIKQYTDAFIDCYGSHETATMYNKVHNVTLSLDANNRIGNFFFRPFRVEHDVECYGYYIYHPEMGFLLFVTDTPFIRQRFARIDHCLIEANYSRQIIDEKVRNSETRRKHRDRVVSSHMSIETCIETLLANNLSQTKNIVLIHLSDDNSNEQDFVEAVTKATGTCVFAAKDGLVVDVNKDAF